MRTATGRYLDIAQARQDGFVQISDMQPRHGDHFLNVNAQLLATAAQLWTGELDLGKPAILLYVEKEGVWKLAGVEYALPTRPARNPFPGDQWSTHEASCHYRDSREILRPSAEQCPARHPETQAGFVLWYPALAIAHVWAWYPNPDGPFAEENRYLAPYGGSWQGAPGHQHPRSGTEVAYSEFNHRSSGIFLLLAAVTFWESRRPRPLTWSALSALLWIVFGTYLFVRSDPEAWPWGPEGFREIFLHPEVLQHKILTLLPVAIGLIEGSRKAGWLRHRAWGYLFPGLAMLGGFYLFFHFHGGAFRLDRIYLQHVAMALASLAVGVTVFFTRRTERGQALLEARG